MTLPEATDAFIKLSKYPVEITTSCFSTLERCVVLLYDRTSSLHNVNEARKYLFIKKSHLLEGIPQSKAALLQNARRAVYQGGHIFRQSMVLLTVVPDPTG